MEPTLEATTVTTKNRSTFWRQLKTMLRKDWIVTLRHPFLLLFELVIPAILFLTICDNRFLQPKMTTHYEPKNYSLFNVTQRVLAYYPQGDEIVEEWMDGIRNLYDPPLTSAQLRPFQTEEDFKQHLLDDICHDCYWASFSINSSTVNYSQVSLNYHWRTSEDFLLDQETGPSADRIYDAFVAENMAEIATIKFFLSKTGEGVKLRHGVKDQITSLDYAQIMIRKFPDVVYYDTFGIYNKISSGAPIVLGLSCLFSFFAFTYQTVSDKQYKLRQSLHTVGLLDSAFWTSLFIIAIGLAALQSLVICICGYISSYIYFLKSPFGLNFFIIWLTFLASHTFAMLVGSFISHIKVLAFVIFVMLILFFIFGSISTNHQQIYPIYAGLSGWQAFFLTHSAQALYLVSLKAIPFIDKYLPSKPDGFKWKDTYSFTGICDDGTCDPAGYDSGHTVAFSISMMVVLIFAQLLLAAYLDLIFPGAHGSSMSPIQPFTAEFWGIVKTPTPPPSNFPGYKPRDPLKEWDADVKQLSQRILAPLNTTDYQYVQDDAIIVYDMDVTFKNIFGKPKQAVRQLSFTVPKNQVIGLLGSNGAGKSTTLSVLTGSLKPTNGYIKIANMNAVQQRSQVSHLLGYAPQFEVLWPDLSPAEHIKIFADLRGLDYKQECISIINSHYAAEQAGLIQHQEIKLVDDNFYANLMGVCNCKKKVKKEIDQVTEEDGLIDNADDDFDQLKAQIMNMSRDEAFDCLVRLRLKDVGLERAGNNQARALSGGMRRRLTLCLALVGNPPILLLDEISTGLDPISRRKIWDVLLRSKTDRSVLLTTHSMLEADTLSDRICIISYGILRCFGTSSRLKRRYGMGYRVDIVTNFNPVSGQLGADGQPMESVNDVLRVKNEIVDEYLPRMVINGKEQQVCYLVGRAGGNLTLAIPRTIPVDILVKFLKELEKRTDIIRSWGVRQTTLEEVFLAITNQAKLRETLREKLEK